MSGIGDAVFLERVFYKLMLNFTWWVNREDMTGATFFKVVFSDSTISVFRLGKPLPNGGYLDQADGTPGVRVRAQHDDECAGVLSLKIAAFEDLATKFFEHFVYIAEAITRQGSAADAGLLGRAGGISIYDCSAHPWSTRPDAARSVDRRPGASACRSSHSTRISSPRFPHFTRAPRLVRASVAPISAAYLYRTGASPIQRGYRLLFTDAALSNELRLARRMLDEAEFLS